MPTPRDYLERLAALNRAPLKETPPEGTPADAQVQDLRRKLRVERSARSQPAAPTDQAAIVYRRDLPQQGRPAPAVRPVSANPVPLHEAVQGAEVERPPWGRAFLRRVSARDVCRYGCEVHEHFIARCGHAGTPVMRRLAALCQVEGVAPADLVFLDLETAGLSNAPVFLVGLMALEDGDLVVSQFLARDYAEEAAITASFVEALGGRRVVVTFNGKTFDLPYMRVRAAATGVPFRAEPAHLDLLHESRRAWRGQVPDCKLQTLERWICGRFRQGDIPGAEVPEAYHAFVRTGDATDIARVLEHNGRDLLTLAELLSKIPDAYWLGQEG